MGADFIMATADNTKPAQHWLDILGEMNDGLIADYIKATEDHLYWEEDYEDELDTNEARTKFYQHVAERVTEAINNCYSDTREVSTLIDGEKKWLITGGMSWGDPPTDIFNDVIIFDSFQAFYQETPVTVTPPQQPKETN